MIIFLYSAGSADLSAQQTPKLRLKQEKGASKSKPVGGKKGGPSFHLSVTGLHGDLAAADATSVL